MGPRPQVSTCQSFEKDHNGKVHASEKYFRRSLLLYKGSIEIIRSCKINEAT